MGIRMYRLIRPLLFCLDPEIAHRLAQQFLNLCIPKCKPNNQQSPIELMGLKFPNRIGMAAGWDKNGDCIDALLSLGFGFVEVGTVTPRPQPGNSKPRLFRIPKAHAVINRMGFNNRGVDYLVARLKQRRVPGIVGVNIGKNKDTPNDRAYEDYNICLEKVYLYADYITINLSSPNTPGLRDLQAEHQLDALLAHIDHCRQQLAQQHDKRVPMLVKLSPDYPHAELEAFVNILLKHHIDGIIATNTSLSREGVEGLKNGSEAGGLSGSPIADRATKTVAAIAAIAGSNLPIIGVGGIDSVVAAKAKFMAGASLIQLYTGLIYQGPVLLKHLLRYKIS